MNFVLKIEKTKQWNDTEASKISWVDTKIITNSSNQSIYIMIIHPLPSVNWKNFVSYWLLHALPSLRIPVSGRHRWRGRPEFFGPQVFLRRTWIRLCHGWLGVYLFFHHHGSGKNCPIFFRKPISPRTHFPLPWLWEEEYKKCPCVCWMIWIPIFGKTPGFPTIYLA